VARLRIIPKVLFFIASALYPVLVFYFLVIRKTPLRFFSLFVAAFALIVFITGTSQRKKNKGVPFLWNSALFLGLGGLCFIVNSAIVLKLYPLLMNILFLTTFASTLFFFFFLFFRFSVIQD
jgi:uncharacterized membrane protein